MAAAGSKPIMIRRRNWSEIAEAKRWVWSAENMRATRQYTDDLLGLGPPIPTRASVRKMIDNLIIERIHVVAKSTKKKAGRAPTPFWDVTNRISRLVISGGNGRATLSIFPKWVRHGAPMHCAVDEKGIKSLLKDLTGAGNSGARAKCQDAPKHRYCYMGELVDGTPLTAPFVIVEKAGKDERRLRVHLGASQVKRLAAGLQSFLPAPAKK